MLFTNWNAKGGLIYIVDDKKTYERVRAQINVDQVNRTIMF